jgi:hypothetical protein
VARTDDQVTDSMTDRRAETEAGASAEPARAARGRYEPPRIVYREKLEAVAALCSPGKAFGQGGGCNITVSS